jgi:AAA ATPase domain
MKFQFTSLGAIDEASIEIAPLTIICGRNNTGKTYATYAMYAFLSMWRQLIDWEVDRTDLEKLSKDGAVSIDMETKFVAKWLEIKKLTCSRWQESLPRSLGAPPSRFEGTRISFDFDIDGAWKAASFKEELRSAQGKILFSAEKPENSSVVEFAALTDKDRGEFPRFALEEFVSQTLLEVVLSPYLPTVFMVSTERTGAVTFKEELNLTKNKIVNFLATMDSSNEMQHPGKLFEAIYSGGYPLPVESNVQFVNRFGSMEGRSGALLKEHPTLAIDFENIAGGQYITNKEGVTHFVPKGSKVQLRLTEASSAARSLVVIWYWLKAEAAKGHMLLIDEPELNLHPENQRAFARFLAKLVNLNVKVLITTHSDTILREFNTLIMLARATPHAEATRSKFGYGLDECLSTEKVVLYVANGRKLTKTGRQSAGTSTLVRVDPSPTLGLAAEIFDSTIIDMGKVQDALRYGAI